MQILDANNLTPNFEDGDAGIIIKRNGTDFQLFNMHKDLDPNAMTPAQIEQGEVLLALAVMMQTPKLLDMAKEFSRQVQNAGTKGDLISFGTAH